jgi:hypothetical protein
MVYVHEGVHVNHHRESFFLGLGHEEWSGLKQIEDLELRQ